MSDRYAEFAWGHDELRPVSQGFADDAGRVALTLVDSLDTLWLMGMKEEFQRGVQWLEESFKLDSLLEVSVFDYGARLLGGLLSAYEISRSEVLLVKAVKVGDLLMKAFDGDLFPSVRVGRFLHRSP